MRLDELRKLAEAAAVEAEGDWFCPDLLENDMPIVSTTKAKRFMHAASPAAVLQLIAVAEAARRILAPWGDCDTQAEAQLRAALSALEKQEQR